MPQFKVQGKHYETGKKQTRLYDVADAAQAEKLGWDDGLVVEKTILIEDKPRGSGASLLSHILKEYKQGRDSMEKKCRHCAMMAPKAAKICPYCRKKFGLSPAAWATIILLGFALPGGALLRNNTSETPKVKPAVKTVSRPALKAVAPIRANESGRATTTKNAIGCHTKQSLDDMIKFTAAGDNESFKAYIQQGRCIILKEGLDVTVIEYPTMLGGTASFVYRGVKMWTTRGGLTDYR